MIFNQSAESFLESNKKIYDGIFLDPPDNIGLKYEGFIDSRDDYIDWLSKLVLECFDHSDVVWLSFNQIHDFELKSALHWYLSKSSWEVKQIIWAFGFGQYRDTDCGSLYRPILRFSRPEVEWNVDAIRVESERMRLGDKRAIGLKVPGDVFDFPRVTGNSHERRSFHPTQHPEALMERIYKMTPGASFLDLFAGSGTSLIVCKRLGYEIDLVDISPFYCSKMKERSQANV